MATLLDLSVYKEETADIRMTDGRLLHLRKPSQRLVIEMLQLGRLTEEMQPEAIADALDRVTAEILNNNADGIPIRRESVEALTLDMKLAIVNAYSEFATRLQGNPTTSSPENRTRRPRPRRS